jgi:hypothetical protein
MAGVEALGQNRRVGPKVAFHLKRLKVALSGFRLSRSQVAFAYRSTIVAPPPPATRKHSQSNLEQPICAMRRMASAHV